MKIWFGQGFHNTPRELPQEQLTFMKAVKISDTKSYICLEANFTVVMHRLISKTLEINLSATINFDNIGYLANYCQAILIIKLNRILREF